MQDTQQLFRALNELEFVIAYQKHVLTTSQCTCDNFKNNNLLELSRVYTNLKLLSNTIKIEVFKLVNNELKEIQIKRSSPATSTTTSVAAVSSHLRKSSFNKSTPNLNQPFSYLHNDTNDDNNDRTYIYNCSTARTSYSYKLNNIGDVESSESSASISYSSDDRSQPKFERCFTRDENSYKYERNQQQQQQDDTSNDSEKRRISRGRVIDELVQTEIDYFKVMKLLNDVYLNTNLTSNNRVTQIQKQAIFCNLKEIVDISNSLLNDFEELILNRTFDKQEIGKCFIKNTQSIKKIYAYYAQYIEHSNAILEKSEKCNDIQEYIQNGLTIIKQKINVFDLHSLLLKPIQRVLKYPLLLQELIKFTDVNHIDYNDLQQALVCMQDVATYINEIKRRRELILKYGRRESSKITERMSKITFHSMIKKSNRFSMRISNAFKLNNSIVVDEDFEKLENKFRNFEKLLKTFSRDSLQHLINLKELLLTQSTTSETINDYLGDATCEEVKNYVKLNEYLLNDYFSNNMKLIQEKVIKPLNVLNDLLEIPNKLINKRNDKLLDYECARLNADKAKDKVLYKTAEDTLYEAQKNYEALNNQLIEELPILLEKCSFIFEKCFYFYIKILRSLYNTIGSKISSLGIDKLLVPKVPDTLESSTIILNNSQEFNRRDRSSRSRASSRDKSLIRKRLNQLGTPVVQLLKQLNNTNRKINENYKQDATLKAKLRFMYKKEDLIEAIRDYQGQGLDSEIFINEGDLIGIIKRQDPNGDLNKWFIDNGKVKAIVSKDLFERDKIERQLSNNSDNNSFSEDSYNNNSRKIYCIVLYDFNAIDSNTLGVKTGDKLIVLKLHDDNNNNEWCLCENEFTNEHGYVPSNYIEILQTESYTRNNFIESELI